MSLKIINKNYIMKFKMRQIIYLIIFLFGLQNVCAACDVLNINIGGDKSEAEEYFGPIEIEEENKEIVTVFTGEAETFCPDSNFGNTYVKMYILEDKVVGVSLQVQNSSDNEESNKQILYNYVISTYGDIENSSDPNWIGYKAWTVGNKKIVYSKSFNHSTEAFIVEELLVSSPEYISSVIDNEPDDS